MSDITPKPQPANVPVLARLEAFEALNETHAGVHDTIIDPDTTSPLWMVTTEPLLNQLFTDLRKLRLKLDNEPTMPQTLEFSKARLEHIREAFANMILQGEQRLHLLSQLICDAFVRAYQLQSVVIGEVDTSKERFTIVQDISVNDLRQTTDIDLGTRQLNKLQFYDGQCWSGASLVANFVDYQPIESNPYQIHKIISRIKAEEEIWHKVADEIFDLDRLVNRDKKLRHLSRFVKDVFGLKIVVNEVDDVYRVQDVLLNYTWSDETLQQLDIEPNARTRRLKFVEIKNYLGSGYQKRSGWEAIKSVVQWGDKTFEIQIQPLRNYLREREYLTQESHASFKFNREQARQHVAEQFPLYAFFQDLLRWLFLTPEAPPPSPPPAYEGLRVFLTE